MNVAELLLTRGDDSAPAVWFRNKIVPHGELRRQVNSLAWALLGRGYKKGDRVGILSENCPFFVVSYLATMRAGMVAVPFPTELSEENFQKIAGHARLKNVFVSDRFFPRVVPWGRKMGLRAMSESQVQALSKGDAGCFPEVDARHDLAALMFTSGSTGKPKGVMITHRNIECNSRDILSYMDLKSDDRAMVVLPFHYCFGASLLHTLLMAGGSVVLNNDFHLYPETMLQEMQRTECTGLAGVPSTYQILLRKSRFRKMSFPRLRWFQQAGGKLPNVFIDELRGAFPQTRFFTMYGQTEACARLSYLPPEQLPKRLGSIGKGLPSTRLEVLKVDGKQVPAGSDEVGEIVASGDNIAPGYWEDPEETAKYFRGGKLYTGDLARVDSGGFIFIVDREREIIKSGGNRVSAKEIEDVIAELAEVVEVAAVGVAHEILGEAIYVFVVSLSEARVSPEMVKAHCRRRLSSFKIPQEVVFLRAMPHNGAGKIIRRALREMIGNRSPVTTDCPDSKGDPVTVHT